MMASTIEAGLANIELGVRLRCVGPFLAAALVEPHPADVLQEACGAVNAALVGEVALIAEVVDDGVAGLDAHQAPRAAAQVGEFLVLGGHCSHGASRVVAGHGNHRYGSQSGELLHLFGEHAYLGGRVDHAPEVVARQAHAREQLLVELLCARVEHLACRGYGVFAHHLAREHVAEGVGNEEYLFGSGQCRVVVLAHGVQLEERVEVHELYAGDVVNLGFVYGTLKVVFHHAERVGVAVRERVA